MRAVTRIYQNKRIMSQEHDNHLLVESVRLMIKIIIDHIDQGFQSFCCDVCWWTMISIV